MEILLWIYGVSAVVQTAVMLWLYWGKEGKEMLLEIPPFRRAYYLASPLIPGVNTFLAVMAVSLIITLWGDS